MSKLKYWMHKHVESSRKLMNMRCRLQAETDRMMLKIKRQEKSTEYCQTHVLRAKWGKA